MTFDPWMDAQAFSRREVDAMLAASRLEIERLRALIAEIDRRVPFESHGFGNTFADSIDCLVMHGGPCPNVEEAYAGSLTCELHKS
jgi:hypothetical protein